jgi:hypothetical protein
MHLLLNLLLSLHRLLHLLRFRLLYRLFHLYRLLSLYRLLNLLGRRLFLLHPLHTHLIYLEGIEKLPGKLILPAL